jgi:tricorn protease
MDEFDAPATQGYYSEPTIHFPHYVFVCEEDLWHSTLSEQRDAPITPRRLTTGGACSRPHFSPNGELLAYNCHEPSEIYVMRSAGGRPKKLTHLGMDARVLGWSTDGQSVIFCSETKQALPDFEALFRVPLDGSSPVPLNIGFGHSLAQSGSTTLLGRFTDDPHVTGEWKRYRGGRMGELWLDPSGEGSFSRLGIRDSTDGSSPARQDINIGSPVLVAAADADGAVTGDVSSSGGDGARVFFVADPGGDGNVFSARLDGTGLARHTAHVGFYPRFLSGGGAPRHGSLLTYAAGGELYVLDTAVPGALAAAAGQEEAQPAAAASWKLGVNWHSPAPQLEPRLIEPLENLGAFCLHPTGRLLALLVRGRPFEMPLWEGPARQLGARQVSGRASQTVTPRPHECSKYSKFRVYYSIGGSSVE